MAELCWDAGMPWRIPWPSRAEAVAIAAQQVMARDGVAGMTLRAIAREVRLSPAQLSYEYGNVQVLIERTAQQCARLRVDDLRDRSRSEGVSAVLPATADDLPDARAWQGWIELSRANQRVAGIVVTVREWERTVLTHATDWRLTTEDLDLLVAAAEGLALAVTLADAPLPLPAARDRLTTLTRRLVRESPPGPEITRQMRWFAYDAVPNL